MKLLSLLVWACCLLPLASAFAAPGAIAACRSAAPAVSMAHHVQKKATRAHNAFRPKKSRPSDIYRKPPNYPAFPDIPWYTKIETSSSAAPAEPAPAS